MKKPRLTDHDRLIIEERLRDHKSVYAIAKELGRPKRTIMREIKNRSVDSDKGAYGRVTNRCIHKMSCSKKDICAHCSYDQVRHCKFCRLCNSRCPDFVEDVCSKLSEPPYVCNGCPEESKCVLRKRFYMHSVAQKNYRDTLVETRRGANITEEELRMFDELLYTLTAQGQSIHAAMTTHADLFSVNEKTIYRYVNAGLLKTKRGDLPRACALKPRKAKSLEHKVDKKCRIGRSYADYLRYTEENPGTPVTEMDLLEGRKGGKVIMTLMFMPYGFMAGILLPGKLSAYVTEAFAMLRRLLVEQFGDTLGFEVFTCLFPLILTDNGSEFSAPERIEKDEEGNHLTRLFYCNPNAAYQKAHVERNHEIVRKILPKATQYLEAVSFDNFTQSDVNLVFSHVNSYVRESLKNKIPYELFTKTFGAEAAEIFGIKKIPPQDVVLKPSLLGIVQKTKNLE